jgi:hypothetical protein
LRAAGRRGPVALRHVATGALPAPAHDIGVTALGTDVYAFGGGTAAGPLDAVTAIDRAGRARPAGRLPVALSDATAVTVGRTAWYSIGHTGILR